MTTTPPTDRDDEEKRQFEPHDVGRDAGTGAKAEQGGSGSSPATSLIVGAKENAAETEKSAPKSASPADAHAAALATPNTGNPNSGPNSAPNGRPNSAPNSVAPNTTPTPTYAAANGQYNGDNDDTENGQYNGSNDDDTAAPEAGRTRLQTWLIMLALCSGLFLAALDTTIVTTAIPTIAAEFDSPSGYTWIGSAYLLANAAAAPSWGKVSDIFGRKPVMLASVAVFWVGSLVCALSRDMAMLLAGRAVQGVGGGGVVVLVNICISDLFSVRARGMYYGVTGMVWAVASAVGPILGGLFTTDVTWRWCFYVNLPICGAAFAVLVFVLKLHNPRTPLHEGLAAIDWTGSLLAIGGTLMLLFGLEFGGISYPWSSPLVICLLVFGVVTIALFLLNEHKLAKHPIIPLRLFHRRTSVISFAVCFCHGFCFISGSYYLPLYFQGVLGASALLSGVYLLPFALSLSVTSALTGVFMKKTGQYLPAIVFGMALLTLGFGLFLDLGPNHDWAKIILYQIVAGVGVGPNFQAPLIALQSAVAPRDTAVATSTFGFIRQLSTSISVVVGGVLFDNEMQRRYPALLRQLGPDLAGEISGASAGASVGLVGGLKGPDGDVARDAYWGALRTMYVLYVAVAGLGLLIAPCVGRRKLSRDHVEAKTGLETMEATRRAAAADAEGGSDKRV